MSGAPRACGTGRPEPVGGSATHLLSDADEPRQFLAQYSGLYKDMASADVSGSADDIEVGPEVGVLCATLERLQSDPEPSLSVLCRLKDCGRLYVSLSCIAPESMDALQRTVDFWDVKHPACLRLSQETAARALFGSRAPVEVAGAGAVTEAGAGLSSQPYSCAAEEAACALQSRRTSSSASPTPVQGGTLEHLSVDVEDAAPAILVPLLMAAGRALISVFIEWESYFESAAMDSRTTAAVQALLGRVTTDWTPSGFHSHICSLISFGTRLDGDVANMQLPSGEERLQFALALAAIERNFVFCDALKLAGAPLSPRLMNTASRVGCIEALAWARANDCPWDADTCSQAAGRGHLSTLQWARANGCPWDAHTCSQAAGRGHLSTLQWARANGCPWDADTCSQAAWGGHLSTLQWARANGCPWDAYTCNYAAWGGHLSTLQWARANGCPWDAHTCSQAAGRGHLSTLQWARANGCPWDADTCRRAAWGGHLSTVQWARANGCPWDAHTCNQAALGGHLSTLQWARANGCPWDAHTCSQAALGGHLSTLQWARANGCPWNADTCSYAGERGHLSTLQWARANGCPWNKARVSRTVYPDIAAWVLTQPE